MSVCVCAFELFGLKIGNEESSLSDEDGWVFIRTTKRKVWLMVDEGGLVSNKRSGDLGMREMGRS